MGTVQLVLASAAALSHAAKKRWITALLSEDHKIFDASDASLGSGNEEVKLALPPQLIHAMLEMKDSGVWARYCMDEDELHQRKIDYLVHLLMARPNDSTVVFV